MLTVRTYDFCIYYITVYIVHTGVYTLYISMTITLTFGLGLGPLRCYPYMRSPWLIFIPAYDKFSPKTKTKKLILQN